MEIGISIFNNKKKAFMKYMEKLRISSKTSLIVNLYILKNM